MLKMQTIDDAVNAFIVGDCKEVMERMPAESIDLVLTSPPYADKRDYGTKNASILPDEYVDCSCQRHKKSIEY